MAAPVKGKPAPLKVVAKVATPVPAPPTPTIVAAVGSAASGKARDLAQRIEAAMAKAVQEAVTAGIWDPATLRQRQLEARARVKAG
jgi:microcystin degradation protein MlrC